MDAEALEHLGILHREDHVVDPAHGRSQVGHDLLAADHQDDPGGADRIRAELAAGPGSGDECAILGHRGNTADHERRRGRQPADLVALGGPVQLEHPGPDGVIAAGFVELAVQARVLEGLRLARVDLGAVRDHGQDQVAGLLAGVDHDRFNLVRAERRGNLLDQVRFGCWGRVRGGVHVRRVRVVLEGSHSGNRTATTPTTRPMATLPSRISFARRRSRAWAAGSTTCSVWPSWPKLKMPREPKPAQNLRTAWR